MPKFALYAMFTASKSLGEFEAETEEKAIAMAEESGETYLSICHQCAKEIDLGDCYEIQAEKLT